MPTGELVEGVTPDGASDVDYYATDVNRSEALRIDFVTTPDRDSFGVTLLDPDGRQPETEPRG